MWERIFLSFHSLSRSFYFFLLKRLFLLTRFLGRRRRFRFGDLVVGSPSASVKEEEEVCDLSELRIIFRNMFFFKWIKYGKSR